MKLATCRSLADVGHVYTRKYLTLLVWIDEIWANSQHLRDSHFLSIWIDFVTILSTLFVKNEDKEISFE